MIQDIKMAWGISKETHINFFKALYQLTKPITEKELKKVLGAFYDAMKVEPPITKEYDIWQLFCQDMPMIRYMKVFKHCLDTELIVAGTEEECKEIKKKWMQEEAKQ